LALANQLPLPVIVQCGWSQHRCISSAIEESDLYLFLPLLNYNITWFFASGGEKWKAYKTAHYGNTLSGM